MYHKLIGLLSNFFLEYCSIEYKNVKSIIHSGIKSNQNIYKDNPFIYECDKVFIDRLEKNKAALTLNFWRKHFEIESLENYKEIKGHILDFGCGSGHLDILLAKKGYRITGFDLSPIAIKIANYYKEKCKLQLQERVNFIEKNITLSNEGNQKFDSVWSTQVFEHIQNPKPILNGIRQYAKDGAYFLICVPLGNAYDDPGHCNHFFKKEELYDFLKVGIDVVRIDVDTENKVFRALCQF